MLLSCRYTLPFLTNYRVTPSNTISSPPHSRNSLKLSPQFLLTTLLEFVRMWQNSFNEDISYQKSIYWQFISALILIFKWFKHVNSHSDNFLEGLAIKNRNLVYLRMTQKRKILEWTLHHLSLFCGLIPHLWPSFHRPLEEKKKT